MEPSLTRTSTALLGIAFVTLATGNVTSPAQQAAAPPMPMFPQPTGRAALTEGQVMLRRAYVQQILPDNPGTGPYAASYSQVSGAEFTVYAPMNLTAAAAKRKLPIYAFGNGGCSYDGAAQRFLLVDIASYGYIAITPGIIRTGPESPDVQQQLAALVAPPLAQSGAPPMDMRGKRQSAELLSKAIDWLVAENGRAESPHYGKIDTTRIAVAGGSCGGMMALQVAFEPRVKSLTMFNSGVFKIDAAMLKNAPPAMRSMLPAVSKDDLKLLHTPVLYMTGGAEDLAHANAQDDFAQIRNVPAFWADRPHTGHIGMAFDPYREGSKIQYHWLEYTPFGDRRAAKMFVGKDCSLCRDLTWQVQQRGL
jgi:dienelactone hydrolase